MEVRAGDDSLLILDAGTGIRRMAGALDCVPRRVDIFLSHLHLDHIQGLGFFEPLYEPHVEVHIWGPAGVMFSLHKRLTRYLSPPLFPVNLRSLPCRLTLHEVPREAIEVGPFRIESAYVCHPGPTVGYRIEEEGALMTYLPDHEPALGNASFPAEPEWTSGYDLAVDTGLLIHDAQYTDEEYASHVGWGHSSISHALRFARLVGAAHLVAFHHDPNHRDDVVEEIVARAVEAMAPSFPVTPAREESTYRVERGRVEAPGIGGPAAL